MFKEVYRFPKRELTTLYFDLLGLKSALTGLVYLSATNTRRMCCQSRSVSSADRPEGVGKAWLDSLSADSERVPAFYVCVCRRLKRFEPALDRAGIIVFATHLEGAGSPVFRITRAGRCLFACAPIRRRPLRPSVN